MTLHEDHVNDFFNKYHVLQNNLHWAGMDHIINEQLHNHTTLTVESNKVFNFRDAQEVAAFALKVGTWHDFSVWACSAGDVVIEPNGAGRARARAFDEGSIAPIVLSLSFKWPNGFRDGLKSKLDSQTHALVLFDIVRWASGATPKPANITELAFPDFENLKSALASYGIPATPVIVPPMLAQRMQVHDRAGTASALSTPAAPVRAALAELELNTVHTTLSIHASNKVHQAPDPASKQPNQVVPTMADSATVQPTVAQAESIPNISTAEDMNMEHSIVGTVMNHGIVRASSEPKDHAPELHDDVSTFGNYQESDRGDTNLLNEMPAHDDLDSKEPSYSDDEAARLVADDYGASRTDEEDLDGSDTSSISTLTPAIAYATSAKLRDAIESEAEKLNVSIDADVLPDLVYFTFEEHNDPDYIASRMFIGECYYDFSEHQITDLLPLQVTYASEKLRILCDLWIQLKVVNRHDHAPHVLYAIGRPVADEQNHKYYDLISKRPVQRHLRYEELCRTMLRNETAKLEPIFRPFSDHADELQALLKYGYILASESPKHTLAAHRIPQNQSFVESLLKVCQRLESTSSGAIRLRGTGLRVQQHDIDRSRRTVTSSEAAADAALTGKRNLDDVSKDVLDELDAVSETASPSTKARRSTDLRHELGALESDRPYLDYFEGAATADTSPGGKRDVEAEDDQLENELPKFPQRKRKRRVVITSSDYEDDDVTPTPFRESSRPSSFSPTLNSGERRPWSHFSSRTSAHISGANSSAQYPRQSVNASRTDIADEDDDYQPATGFQTKNTAQQVSTNYEVPDNDHALNMENVEQGVSTPDVQKRPSQGKKLILHVALLPQAHPSSSKKASRSTVQLHSLDREEYDRARHTLDKQRQVLNGRITKGRMKLANSRRGTALLRTELEHDHDMLMTLAMEQSKLLAGTGCMETEHGSGHGPSLLSFIEE